jgi:hypothetical protein
MGHLNKLLWFAAGFARGGWSGNLRTWSLLDQGNEELQGIMTSGRRRACQPGWLGADWLFGRRTRRLRGRTHALRHFRGIALRHGLFSFPANP